MAEDIYAQAIEDVASRIVFSLATDGLYWDAWGVRYGLTGRLDVRAMGQIQAKAQRIADQLDIAEGRYQAALDYLTDQAGGDDVGDV